MTPDELTELVRAYNRLFASEDGKRVLEDLSRACYESAVTFVNQNPTGTAFNEGKRFVMLHIRRRIATDLEHPPEPVARTEKETQ